MVDKFHFNLLFRSSKNNKLFQLDHFLSVKGMTGNNSVTNARRRRSSEISRDRNDEINNLTPEVRLSIGKVLKRNFFSFGGTPVCFLVVKFFPNDN